MNASTSAANCAERAGFTSVTAMHPGTPPETSPAVQSAS